MKTPWSLIWLTVASIFLFACVSVQKYKRDVKNAKELGHDVANFNGYRDGYKAGRTRACNP